MRRLTGVAGLARVVLSVGQVPRYPPADPSASGGVAPRAARLLAMDGGPIRYRGWGLVILANVPPALWFVAASPALLRGQASTAPPPPRKVLPRPGCESTQMRPPWRPTIFWQMARPMPVPG